jgi:peptidoglycan-associated lipoprotein
MRKSTLVLALLAAVALVACGGVPPPEPPPPPPPAPTPPPPAPTPEPTPIPQPSEYDRIKTASIDEIERMNLMDEIHFDFDKSDIREADGQILQKNAGTLKKLDYLKITIEGHCDERGTVEYNLALGERRAQAAYDYLVSLGVPVERMKTVSYGKEVPLCQESTEDCWDRTRRAHFTVTGKAAN